MKTDEENRTKKTGCERENKVSDTLLETNQNTSNKKPHRLEYKSERKFYRSFNYLFSSASCGGEIIASQYPQSISSGPVETYSNCIWRIKVPPSFYFVISLMS